MRNTKAYRNIRKNVRGRNIAITVFSAMVLSFVLFGITAKGVEADQPQAERYKYYTSVQIQEGDTLWEIAGDLAEKYDLSRQQCLEELKTMNNIHGDRIRTGNYLTVFYYSEEYK